MKFMARKNDGLQFIAHILLQDCTNSNISYVSRDNKLLAEVGQSLVQNISFEAIFKATFSARKLLSSFPTNCRFIDSIVSSN